MVVGSPDLNVRARARRETRRYALRNVSACNSACVFALIGAKVRYVPPGAQLGVHASRVVIYRPDGGKINASSKQIASLQKERLAELQALRDRPSPTAGA